MPEILRTDMANLQDSGDHASSQGLTMQQRVIQSGLDSLVGNDASQIVELFKGFAVFPEDCIFTLPVVDVLWVSLGGSHKPLSPLKLRQYTSQLLVVIVS